MKLKTLSSVSISVAAATAVSISMMLPVDAFAATYEYVGTNGTLETITADTADEAIATAPDINPHSGVILLPPAPITTSATSTAVVPGAVATTTVMTQTIPTTGMSSTTVTTTASTTATSTQS